MRVTRRSFFPMRHGVASMRGSKWSRQSVFQLWTLSSVFSELLRLTSHMPMVPDSSVLHPNWNRPSFSKNGWVYRSDFDMAFCWASMLILPISVYVSEYVPRLSYPVPIEWNDSHEQAHVSTRKHTNNMSGSLLDSPCWWKQIRCWIPAKPWTCRISIPRYYGAYTIIR